MYRIEYLPSGNVAAAPALKEEIGKHGLRELIRTTGLSQHTIEAIRNGKPVRRATLAILKQALLDLGRDDQADSVIQGSFF